MGDVTLRTDQLADLTVLMAQKKVGLLNDPGTGKTPTVCVMQWYMWNELGVGTVWMMPKSLLGKNRREILKFTPFKPEDVVIVQEPKKLTPQQKEVLEKVRDGANRDYFTGAKKAAFTRLMKEGFITEEDKLSEAGVSVLTGTPKEFATGAKVFLMGFDRFKLTAHLLPDYVKAVHVDEWHKGFKGNDSTRTQTLYLFMQTRRIEWFVPMTGTLISGSLDSCYPAIHLIEPRYYTSFDHFKQEHSLRDEYDRPLLWRGHDKLAAIFQKHSIRRTFKDIFGDQEVVFVPEVCVMSEKHRNYYDKFKKDAFLDLEKFVVDGGLPGVGFIRGRQIQEIPNQFPDLRDVDEEGNLRPDHRWVDILKDELPDKEERFLLQLEDHQRTGKPFVAVSSLRRQQKRLYEHAVKMGLKVALLDSDTNAKQRDEIDQAFQNGELQGIIGSIAIMDVGFNWQFWGPNKIEVEHAMLITVDFLDTSITQVIRRFIRQERNTPLRISVYEYEDSLDQRMFQMLEDKSTQAHKVDPSREVIRLGAKSGGWRWKVEEEA